jgi:hypothetical protein
MEGMVDEGLAIVAALRKRYDGTRRNPYNEIECGDHYARAMAGWSVLEALSGFRYDATTDALRFAPAGSPANFRSPVILNAGWGTFSQTRDAAGSRISLACTHGEMRVRSLSLGDVALGTARITVGSQPVDAAISHANGALTMAFAELVVLGQGTRLEVEVTA